MGKIDVLDLDISIARYIYKGITGYITQNEKMAFPTAPSYDFFENLTEDATLDERVKEWHILLHEIADKFLRLTKRYHISATDEEIKDAFDSLAKVYRCLWI